MLRQQCFVNRVDLRFVVVAWARETANVRIALDLARSMTFDDVTGHSNADGRVGGIGFHRQHSLTACAIHLFQI